MKRLRRIGRRALHYIQVGYSLASLPFVFLGYASSIYYLAIENVPLLKSVFPCFTSFLIVAGVTLPLLCGIVGYAFLKKLWFYRASQEIITEANPYTTVKTTPVGIPMYEAMRELMNELLQTPQPKEIYHHRRRIAEALDEIIERSRS